MEGILNVSGWWVSPGCHEGVSRVSGRCLECVWWVSMCLKVSGHSGWCMKGVCGYNCQISFLILIFSFPPIFVGNIIYF